MSLLKKCYFAFFIIVILFSIFCTAYILQFDFIMGHEQETSFNRVFLNPEHGRYLSTFISSLFVQRIPDFLNIHPNDVYAFMVVPFKSILIALFVLIFTYSFYIFDNSNKKLSDFFITPSGILTYIVLYTTLFSHKNNWLAYNDLCFYEYPMSFLVYIPLCIMFFKYCIVQEEKYLQSRFNFILFTVLTFLAGITVELFNFPILLTYIVFLSYSLYEYKQKRITKDGLNKILIIFSVYLISLFLYFINPVDNDLFVFNTGEETGNIQKYISVKFPSFFEEYAKIWLVPCLRTNIIIAVIFLTAFILNKENRNKTIKTLGIIFTNLNCFLIYPIAIFISSDELVYSNYKVITVWNSILLLYIFISLGYLTNIQKFIKAEYLRIIFILIFCFMQKDIFLNYKKEIKNTRDYLYNSKKCTYIKEKYAIKSGKNCEILYIPKYCKNYYNDIGNINYLKNIHDINIREIVFSDEHIDKSILTEEELKELKFTKLYEYKKAISE